jgi:niacin transporter
MKVLSISIKKLCTGALLLALGILLPQVFHMLGGQALGGFLLPMHISVFLAGFLIGPYLGLIVGLITPIISFFLTGMPPTARLPFMIIELMAYGLFSGLFYQHKWNIYLSLIAAQVCGRVFYALSLLIAAHLFHLNALPVIAVWTAVTTGLPGIVIQILLIPPLVAFLKKVASF